MAIDIRVEELLSLTAATKLPCFRNRRNGSRINVATLWRWATTGCKGCRLETVKAGGCRATSIEAIERFFADIAATEAVGRPATPRPASIPPHRRKQIDAAKKRLMAAGIL